MTETYCFLSFKYDSNQRQATPLMPQCFSLPSRMLCSQQCENPSVDQQNNIVIFYIYPDQVYL